MKTKKKNFDYFECLVNMSVYALEEAKLLKGILTDFNPDEFEGQLLPINELEQR